MIQTKCVYVSVSCDRAERSPQHVLRNVLPKGENWGLYDRGDDVGVTEDIPAHSNGKIRIIKSISGIIILATGILFNQIEETFFHIAQSTILCHCNL